ncbi:DUF262 and DUF1524 domain-containing protein [Campylobacter sp. RM5004]|uniref:DUF262 domain-containing protein n=1 Tax=Campylobacter sp. RM5004 TaxID=1660078 RepID=UPI001EFBAF83|nr:DUF262 domain-containing protein [Campylobacter sp. RM5004]ULO01954.1 DUF262 and DUF1524 domain-containing protein [Campylobacter sp. RM5004]
MDTKAEIKIINDIKGYGFIIPPYQRLYAWKDEQIKTLLDDFKNCIEHNKNQKEQKSHFIGNIVVSEDNGKYVLIDGQQRLTTIWLVLRYLLQGKFKKEDYFDIEMPIREEDVQAIDKYCKGKTLDECFNEKNNTNVGFKNAFKFFEVYFGKDNEEDKQQRINFIKKDVKFNLVILSDQVELNKYFVRMNNTGVQLDGTDILKARLLKLISDYEKEQKIQNEKSEVTKYARIFDECSQMNYFSDFSFIDNNTNTNTTKPTIENIIKNEKKLQNYSNNNNDRVKFESIIDFPTFILHVFKILSRQESNIFKKDIKISIKKDKFLENTWDKLNDGLNAEQAKTIIDALKEYRTIFDTFVIKRKADNEENEYKLWNKNNNWNEVSDANDLAIIQNYLRIARSGDNANYHHFLTHYLEFCKNEIMSNEIMSEEGITRKKCLDNLKDSNNADNLRKYLKSIDDFLALKQLGMANNLIDMANLIDIISDVSFGQFNFDDQTNKIKESIKNLNFENVEKNTDKPNFNFLNYGTNTPHYWFYRLEYYLLTDENFKKKHNDDIEKYRFRYVNSVEHVLAQNDLDGLSKDKENQKVLNDFGNLALITDGENSTFSNNVFVEKKRIFNKFKSKDKKIISLKLLDIYKNEEYQKNDKDNNLNSQTWQAIQIEKHREKMLDILKNSFKN